MDIDFVAANGGLAEVDIGARGGSFGDEMAGVRGEVGSSALRGAFGDEMAGALAGADQGVVRDRLVGSVVSVLPVLFLRVELDLEIVLESMFEGVLGSPSGVDAV